MLNILGVALTKFASVTLDRQVIPIATKPRQFFSAEKGSTLFERSEFVIPPVKKIVEGSRRPKLQGFLLVFFFARQRKEHKKPTFYRRTYIILFSRISTYVPHPFL